MIRTGKRRNGESLFLFAPHSFFSNLSLYDARALAAYLKSLPAIRNTIAPRDLPFTPTSTASVSALQTAPLGRSLARATYLLNALVGCRECHSYAKDGRLLDFAGADPRDPVHGVFRLGPDLPLRQTERGFAAFPYPGYAILYAGNLTTFGIDGPQKGVPAKRLVRAIREGIAVDPDEYGRPRPLAHIMMWQFYVAMNDDDAYSIAEYIKTLHYVPHDIGQKLIFFGTDWEDAFTSVFGSSPSQNDRKLFGKP